VLFIFSGFADDPQSVLATVHRLALVGIELLLKSCDRVFYSESLAISDLELLIAVSADAKIWSRANALDDPEGAFFHTHSLAHLVGGVTPVEIKRHHYRKPDKLGVCAGKNYASAGGNSASSAPISSRSL